MHTHASDDRRSIASVELLRLTSAGQVRMAAPIEGEIFMLSLQRSGGATLHQCGRCAALTTGDLALCSSSHAYQLELQDHSEQIVMMMPAAPLRQACADIDALTAVLLKSTQPLVRMLGLMADSYFDTPLQTLPQLSAQHAARALIDTAAGCMLACCQRDAAKGSDASQYHLKRIREFVLAHLGDSDLTVARVGSALGLSTAHIHRLFASEAQTFSAWLWESRLLACRQVLKQSSPMRRSITSIAQQHGFNHASHFSRAFRARFGFTASAWRSSAD
jgi:AraC-like DNA-binding protein